MCLHGKIKLIHASKLHLHERFEQKRLAKLTDSLDTRDHSRVFFLLSGFVR